MKYLMKVVDNPVALTGLLLAVFAVLSAFGIDLSEKQTTALLGLAGAALLFLQTVVLPKRKVVSRTTNDGQVVAGQASAQQTGTPVLLAKDPLTGDPVPVAPVRRDLVNSEVLRSAA